MPRSGYQANVSIGTTSTALLPAGNHRHCIIISNPTQDVLYISFGQTAVVGQGLVVPPNVRPERIYKEEIGGLINATIFGIFQTTPGDVGVLVGYES